MTEREANERGHPPYCTCVDCTNDRMSRWRRLGRTATDGESGGPPSGAGPPPGGGGPPQGSAKGGCGLLPVFGLLIVALLIAGAVAYQQGLFDQFLGSDDEPMPGAAIAGDSGS